MTRSRPPHGSSASTCRRGGALVVLEDALDEVGLDVGVPGRHGGRDGDADDQRRHHDPAHARDPPAYADGSDHEEGQHHDRDPQHQHDAQHDRGDLEPRRVEGEVERAAQVVGQEERSDHEGGQGGHHGHEPEHPASGPPESGAGQHGRHQRDPDCAAHRGRATEPGCAASRATGPPAYARRPTHREPRTDCRGETPRGMNSRGGQRPDPWPRFLPSCDGDPTEA